MLRYAFINIIIDGYDGVAEVTAEQQIEMCGW